MSVKDKVRLKPMDALETVDSHSFIQDYVLQHKPVLIRGVAQAWPAYKKWTDSAFVAEYGTCQTMARRGTSWTVDAKMFSLSEYLQYMETTTDERPYYFSEWDFGSACPELIQDYTVPDYLENWLRRVPDDQLTGDEDQALRWIYIGAKNTGSSMHRDIWDTSAWNTVFTGKKEWLFYGADQTENVYAGAVDGFNPDLETYPKFREAQGYTCIQEPGDLVYTPSLWWHQVRNLEAGISLTENMINTANIERVIKSFMAIAKKNKATPDADRLDNSSGKAYFNLLKEYIPEIEQAIAKIKADKRKTKTETGGASA
ncbi:MAG: cupin-like domain-containing protein [Leptolyngbyaceae cyanobacterium]